MKRARRHLTSIALLVAAAGVATYAYLDRGALTESEKKMREGSVFVAWRRDDLTRIELVQGGSAAPLILERVLEDGGDRSWFLRSPRAERADDAAVEKLVSALELAGVVREVSVDAGAGLDAPRVRGTVTMGAVRHELELGGPAPTPAGAAYLRREGAPGTSPSIVVVSRDLATALLQPADAYRTRAIVPFLSIELEAMEVRGAGTHFTIARADAVSFRGPDGVRVSRERLDGVWSALAAMRAEAFVSDADADRATAQPRVVVTMSPSDASKGRGEIVVGDACPGHPDDVVVVRRAPTRLSACAPKGVLDGLAPSADSLRDDQLFVAHDDEVSELRLETLPGGASLDLARKEGGWRERAPADRDLSPDETEAATDLVRAVVKATGAPLGAVPFEPRGRVTVARVDAPAPEVVELGAPLPGGDVPVRRVFDGVVLRVPRSAARSLVPRAVALRPRSLWSPPIEGRSARALETRCDGVAQRLTASRPGGWTFDEPAGFRADTAAVLELVDLIARAKADAWVADVDDGTFGLDGSPCRIALTVEETDAASRTVSIDFGREAYARIDGVVLEAPAYLRDRARSWLVDRHGFVVPRGAEVTLRLRGRPVAASEAALESLASLAASDVVHLGSARAPEALGAPFLEVVSRTDAGRSRFVLGAATTLHDTPGYFARVDGTDATFFVARDRVQALAAPAAADGGLRDE